MYEYMHACIYLHVCYLLQVNLMSYSLVLVFLKGSYNWVDRVGGQVSWYVLQHHVNNRCCSWDKIVIYTPEGSGEFKAFLI